MTFLKEVQEHRASLIAFVENHEAQGEEAIKQFEGQCKAIVSQLRADNSAASAEMKKLVADRYGEPDRDDVELAKNVIEAGKALEQAAPVDAELVEEGEVVAAEFTKK